MTDLTVQHTTLSVSSVRSSVSTASSGYAIISAPAKARKSVKDVYPNEPPPDYDEDCPCEPEILAGNVKAAKCPPYTDEKEVSVPLIPQQQQIIRTQSPTNDGSLNGSQRPLLHPNGRTSVQKECSPGRQIVRINSRSHDLNIEIVSTSQSPNSTTADSQFLYKNSKKRNVCCRSLSCKQKCIIALSVIIGLLVIAFIVVILYFTTCVFENDRSECEN